MSQTSPSDFLPLKPRVHLILLLLAERPRHGYDLLQDLERRSDGSIRPNPGSFYRLLHGMARDGLVTRADLPEDHESGGGERKSYALTDLGLEALRAEVHRQEELLKLARRWAL